MVLRKGAKLGCGTLELFSLCMEVFRNQIIEDSPVKSTTSRDYIRWREVNIFLGLKEHILCQCSLPLEMVRAEESQSES